MIKIRYVYEEPLSTGKIEEWPFESLWEAEDAAREFDGSVLFYSHLHLGEERDKEGIAVKNVGEVKPYGLAHFSRNHSEWADWAKTLPEDALFLMMDRDNRWLDREDFIWWAQNH